MKETHGIKCWTHAQGSAWIRIGHTLRESKREACWVNGHTLDQMLDTHGIE